MGNFYFNRITNILSAAKSDAALFDAIVNAPFHDRVKTTQMDLGIVVLLLVDKKHGTIDRVALSDTELAAGAVKMSEKPFKEIKIPLGHKDNAIARAIETGQTQFVTDWKHLFTPALNPRAARFNQAGAGIEFSAVYPLKARSGGAIIFSYFQVHTNIGPNHDEFMERYGQLVDACLRSKRS